MHEPLPFSPSSGTAGEMRRRRSPQARLPASAPRWQSRRNVFLLLIRRAPEAGQGLPCAAREIAKRRGENMPKNAGKPKAKCKNCEGKGLLKQGNKKVKCQRCGGTGFKS
jgi:hypothetical protein